MFNFACDLGLNHDAYTAAIANPISDKSADSIRRLVQALADQGDLAQLLALPWAGVVEVERQGIREPVPVVQVCHHLHLSCFVILLFVCFDVLYVYDFSEICHPWSACEVQV